MNTEHDIPNAKLAAPKAVPTAEVSSLAPVSVLVLWLACLTVGLLGFALPYECPKAVSRCDRVTEIQQLEVELSQAEIAPLPAQADLPVLPEPPDVLAPPPAAELNSLVPVAELPDPVIAAVAPTPAVAFPVPVSNPQHLTENPATASYQTPAATVPPLPTTPAPQKLTFGHGEGKQPEPTYPDRAQREGQEGTVTVRLAVNAEGRVVSAHAHQPSPWPLLNEAAVRTIRRFWSFKPGAARLFEVAIRFELRK